MPAEKDHADVLVPPPAALVLCVAAGWLANRLWPAPFPPRASPLQAIGFAVAAIGVAIAILAIVQFRRARTSVRPDRPSKRHPLGRPVSLFAQSDSLCSQASPSRSTVFGSSPRWPSSTASCAGAWWPARRLI